MANPPKPAELKLLQGNPGKRGMRLNDGIAPLEYGFVEPPESLGDAGRAFWLKIFGGGELWISVRTDTTLVQLVCEQMDRRERLRELWELDPSSRPLSMSMTEIEKEIKSGLSLLGFTPADRTRLGLVSAKTKSKLQELIELRESRG